MQVTWSVGAVVAVLLSVASYLFQLPFARGIGETIALILILVGVWTIVAAVFIIEKKDRAFYGGWGVLMALLSLFAYLQPAYALGFLLIAIVLLIVAMVFAGRGKGIYTASTSPPSPSGGAPAAVYPVNCWESSIRGFPSEKTHLTLPGNSTPS
ncbi:MAG: hypothetical protein HY296_03985 [Thaumarchaeota archaeon]|nr:hypothetical protein [Nitrososphaerota archaeon]